MSDEKEIRAIKALLDDVEALIAKEKESREKHHIGDRFRAIPHQLQELQQSIKANIKESGLDQAQGSDKAASIESGVLVYVYLYNAQGRYLQRWVNMISSRQLQEYGVNRPIYREKAQIDALIKAKSNVDEHAYLSVEVDKASLEEFSPPRHDMLGQPLVKLRERSLSISNLKNFTHKGLNYHWIDGKLTLV